jgi:nucleoside 2-deoxyribosyltransferase
MKRIYIAGPMSGHPELNFPAFHAEATRLRALGFDVVNPAEINADPNAGWHACMRDDIAQLVRCDGIARLPGWEASRGARIEVGLATSLEMHVVDAADIQHPCAIAT